MVDVDFNVDFALAKKRAATEKARLQARPISELRDEKGQVRLWLVKEKRWVKVWPVDAMEIMKSGTANLDGPEPELDNEPETEPALLANLTIPKLREYAELKGINVSELKLKADILAAIQKTENPETNKENQE